MSFSKKDFLLLQDAINDALQMFYADPAIASNRWPVVSAGVETRLRNALADSFNHKLKYTSDGFDPEQFRAALKSRLITDSMRDTVPKA